MEIRKYTKDLMVLLTSILFGIIINNFIGVIVV